MLASCAWTAHNEHPNVVVVPAGFDDVVASGWQHWPLPGKNHTRYSVVQEAGRSVIRADATASASMLRRMMHVPAEELHRLEFSWKVPRLIAGARLSDGDLADAPVRVVLAFEGDRSKLSVKNRVMFELAEALTGEAPPYATLMYVWDSHAPLEAVIPGGRSDRIRKIVVDSGASHLHQWRQHERMIAEDYRRAFGEEPGALKGVALMTDTDNTRQKTRAYYGDVRLVAKPGG
jgi:hypothetical protein